MSTAVVHTITTLPQNGDVEGWTPGERAMADAAGLVFTHTYGAKEGQREPAPRAVVEKFLHVCRITGLDPLTRQIYCIGRLSRGTVEWAIQTSIDGFRVVAQRSGKYAGQEDAEWLTEKGEWVDVFVKQLHGANPLAARVRVLRGDWAKPASGIATWESYVQTKSNGQVTSMWDKMGPLMLAKCAEALAFRKAFPQDLSGLYTADEMMQSVKVEAVEQAEAPQQRQSLTTAPSEATRAPAPQEAQQTPVATVQAPNGASWGTRAEALRTSDEVMALFAECRNVGQLGQLVEFNGEQIEVRAYLSKLGTAFKAAEATAAATSSSDDEVVEAEIVPDDQGRSAIWDHTDEATGEVK